MTILAKETMVQVFRNPADETFHVISVNGADLKFAGQSYHQDTWFPGLKWTTCVCSKCGHHMGWYFENDKDNFVGLVLEYVVSSHYADSVLRVPAS
uniref:CULT domain-containing protein n=1 Tax=Acrobeloides nanus TaxID=290746 RepID=A0A914CQ77_9BILA